MEGGVRANTISPVISPIKSSGNANIIVGRKNSETGFQGIPQYLRQSVPT